MSRVVLETPMLYADHHVLRVRRALLAVPGVSEVVASAAFRRVQVDFDPAQSSEASLRDLLAELGYLAKDGQETAAVPQANGHGDPAWAQMPMRTTRTLASGQGR